MRFFTRSINGAAAVEFALILPILFSVVVGIADFGIVMMRKNDINIVINTGFHYALLKSDDASAIERAMTNAISLTPLIVSATQVCRCAEDMTASCNNQCSDMTSPAHYYRLEAETSVNPIFTVFLTNPYVIKTFAVVRVQ
jgi:Flp pilus assembly protein TadG